MRALLFVIGLLLAVAGCVVGGLSFYSPGEVILGFNLGLAATLMVGGLMVIAMSSIIGAINDLAASIIPAAGAQMVREAAPAVAENRAATFAAAAVATTAAGAAVAKTVDAGATADNTLNGGSQTMAEGDDALDPVQADVRKPLAIEEVQVDTSADGSATVSEKVGAAPNDSAQSAPEPNSVAARIGAITAGVKAAAESADDKFEEAADSAEEAAGAVTETAEGMSETAGQQIEDVARAPQEAITTLTETVAEPVEPVIENAAEATQIAEETTEDSSEFVQQVEATSPDQDGEAAEDISGTAVVDETAEQSEAADEDVVEGGEAAAVVQEAEETVAETVETEVSSVHDEPDVEVEQTEADDTPQAEPAANEEEGALYVVEETTVRERPARMLSDGTVEAETDAGWMRFENMDHLNEYLDAMSA